MKRKRHNTAEIAAKLKKAAALAAQGNNQQEITQALGISVMTLHRWRKAHPEIVQFAPASETESAVIPRSAPAPATSRHARIAELRLENNRLRRLVTDLLLEKLQLEEEARKNSGLALKRA